MIILKAHMGDSLSYLDNLLFISHSVCMQLLMCNKIILALQRF